MTATTTIYFDMDGTIADLYGVPDWLEDLQNEDVRPYKVAKPLLNLNSLARILNRLQREGYKIGIISWLSKCGSAEYNQRVTATKEKWLKKHLSSVHWDEVHIVKYGTPKYLFQTSNLDILFDDESENRKTWKGFSFNEKNILKILKEYF